MQRDNQYTFKSRVRFSEVDHTKRITLPGIVNYFQDCSNFQSEELGLGVDHFAKYKRAWSCLPGQVVIDRYPSLGEEISVSTWATEFNGLYGLRNFCMEDEGRQMTACANSVWVYMDIEKGRAGKAGRRRDEGIRRRGAPEDGVCAQEDRACEGCRAYGCISGKEISYRYQ